ncbi:MAG: serine protease [Methanosarcinaceae archaeon]|nr:serine protease [Methanosarcinaceae archaeon]
MIRSGGSFVYKGKSCIIGAVIPVRGLPYIVTVSHIFRRAGDHVTVEGKEVTVKSIIKDYDLALIGLPSRCTFEFTIFGSALVLENALLANEHHIIECRVLNAGASLIYLGFSCSDMPQSGDSGSPVLQAGKVIGIISSVLQNNCMGVAISSGILRNMS